MGIYPAYHIILYERYPLFFPCLWQKPSDLFPGIVYFWSKGDLLNWFLHKNTLNLVVVKQCNFCLALEGRWRHIVKKTDFASNIVFSFAFCRIEKKRSVVPELAEAVKTRDGREVNWEYFYQLLFTLNNLKLVHIACHKKTNHNLSCDKTKIYRKRKQTREIS